MARIRNVGKQAASPDDIISLKDLNAALAALPGQYLQLNRLNQPSGVPQLDVFGRIPSSSLPTDISLTTVTSSGKTKAGSLEVTGNSTFTGPILGTSLTMTTTIQAIAFEAESVNTEYLTVGQGLTLDHMQQEVKDAINNGRYAYNLPNGGVPTSDLADGSVTTPKIASKAVGTGKIADDAITSTQLSHTAITSDHIPTNAILGKHLTNQIVTGQKMAVETIFDANIAPNAAIQFSKISGAPFDFVIVQSSGVRRNGHGDLGYAVTIPRGVILESVTYQFGTKDGGGGQVMVYLTRSNGWNAGNFTAIAGSEMTISNANQEDNRATDANRTTTITPGANATLAAGERLGCFISGIGSSPGKMLVAVVRGRYA